MLLALYQIEHVFPGIVSYMFGFLLCWIRFLVGKKSPPNKIEFQSLRFHQQYVGLLPTNYGCKIKSYKISYTPYLHILQKVGIREKSCFGASKPNFDCVWQIARSEDGFLTAIYGMFTGFYGIVTGFRRVGKTRLPGSCSKWAQKITGFRPTS